MPRRADAAEREGPIRKPTLRDLRTAVTDMVLIDATKWEDNDLAELNAS